jgi:hypothetical protein
MMDRLARFEIRAVGWVQALGRDVLDTVVLVVATAFAVAGVGGLILHQIRAARAEGRRFTDDLGWTLLWALGLSVLFIAGWLSGR